MPLHGINCGIEGQSGLTQKSWDAILELIALSIRNADIKSICFILLIDETVSYNSSEGRSTIRVASSISSLETCNNSAKYVKRNPLCCGKHQNSSTCCKIKAWWCWPEHIDLLVRPIIRISAKILCTTSICGAKNQSRGFQQFLLAVNKPCKKRLTVYCDWQCSI